MALLNMRLINLKITNDRKVEKWLEKNIKDLTPYQKECIRDSEVVRTAPFVFCERRKKVDNIFLRLTLPFMLITLLALVISLPFNFFIRGVWGYNKLDWFSKWLSACGF